MVVRQRHAHSWVEAIVTPNDKDYHWITLDPTPGQARQAVVAQIGGVPVSLRQLYDASKHVWSSYVLNFNAGEQEAAVYGPIREFIQGYPQSWGRVLLAAFLLLVGVAFGRRPVRWLMAQLRGQESRVNKQPRGGPRGRLLAWVANWLRTLFTPAAWFTPSGRPRIAFYERLLRVLESHGLSKLPTWTPQQFALQAGVVLERQRNSVAVARIPAELIDYFYRARFGQHRLGAHESAEIDLKLRSLTEALSRKE